MRHELFPGAVSPTVAIFYVPTYPLLENKLVYGVPKPSPLSQQLKAIILDTTEVKFLNLAELLDKPFLWKIALWGNYRDSALIERLKTIPTLYEQLKNLGWNEPREGLQVGESDKDNRNEQRSPTTDFLKNIPFLPTEKFRPFSINFDSLEPIKEQRIHRSRDEKIYYAPLVLIHQSKCQAAFVNSNISYLASISGVTGKQGQENLLKWLVCLINSPLTRYYQFLTSTRWAIERANPLHKEYIDMPFLIPDNQDSNFQNVLYYFDKITELLNQDELFYNTTYEQKLTEYIAEINRLVYIIYGLHPTEQRLVEDMLEYGLEFFNWSKLKERKSQAVKAVQRPPEKMLEIYANLFVSTVTSLLRIKNQTLNATVYQNGTPLTVVSFTIIDSDKTELVQVVTQSDAMRSKLRELDEFLLERKTPSMYIRRHVRVYDGNQVSLVRPSEQRFWTQSQARADADAFLAELSA